MYMKYILRLLALPFFLAVHLIYTIGFMLRNAKDFMLYGGESMIHRMKDHDTVHSMLEEIRNRQRMDNYQANMKQWVDMDNDETKLMLKD